MVRHKKVGVPQGGTPVVHFAIWLLMFVVLLAVGSRFFSQIYDTTELAEAQAAIGNFTSSVINIHKDWILQGRPRKVRITALDDQGNPGKDWIILMNKSGWPINVLDGTDVPDCAALWFALQKADRLAFDTVLVKMERKLDGSLAPMAYNPDVDEAKLLGVWVCQNIVAGKLHFQYRLDTGKVERQ